MPRIGGIDIPENKQIGISLTYIYGIGDSLAKRVTDKAKVDFTKKTKDLTEKELNSIRKVIEEEYKVEGDLRRIQQENLKRLKEIQCWRGIRHKKRLPVRGQSTKRNSRTVRGNRR